MSFTVAIAEVKQETNTSAPPTTLKDFEDFHLFYGDQIKTVLGDVNSEIAGFYEVLSKEDVEIVPIIATFAVSGGPVNTNSFEYLVSYLTENLSKIERLDGLLIALHGALVTDHFHDGDSELLRRVREVVGTDIPISVTMDLHGNITKSKVELATTISGFHTCPHVDLKETGARAAKLLMGVLKREINPRMELFTVQPWLDIEELGWAVVVIANNSREEAAATAKIIASNIWQKRELLSFTELLDPGEAIALALNQESGPIILSDLADGTMAGSPGDSPVVLRAAIEIAPKKKVFISICDPEFVKKAEAIGSGETIASEIGATWGRNFYQPLKISGQIISITNAEFTFTQKSYLGMKMQMGMTALIKISNIYLVVTSNPATTTDPAYYAAVGLDVLEAQVVVVKTHAGFRDGYRNIAKGFYLLNTPGMSSDDIKNLPYKNIERPKYPWDAKMNWKI